MVYGDDENGYTVMPMGSKLNIVWAAKWALEGLLEGARSNADHGGAYAATSKSRPLRTIASQKLAEGLHNHEKHTMVWNKY